LLLCWLFGCSRHPATPEERGRATFVRICSGCHGLEGKGGGSLGASFQTPPRDLTDHEFQAGTTDEQLLFVMRNGKGNMPPFAALLSEAQLRDVLAYVRTLSSRTN
jgi:mono/diheme cytochrome c family protein